MGIDHNDIIELLKVIDYEDLSKLIHFFNEGKEENTAIEHTFYDYTHKRNVTFKKEVTSNTKYSFEVHEQNDYAKFISNLSNISEDEINETT